MTPATKLNLFDLSGRTALITGSSKGIGLALAGALASAGARVVLNARDANRLEATRQALASSGKRRSTRPAKA